MNRNYASICGITEEYRLGIPNLEVREGLFKNLASHYSDKDATEIYPNVRDVRKLLEGRRIDEAMERLRKWHTSAGRIDLLLSMRNVIYIIELKRDGTPDEALEQIRTKDYGRQFADDPRPLVSLGVTFSTQTRNITAWKAIEG